MYLLPMWCLCLSSAKSLCSELTNRTNASPFLLPWAFRQRATPPLECKANKIKSEMLDLMLFVTFSTSVQVYFCNPFLWSQIQVWISSYTYKNKSIIFTLHWIPGIYIDRYVTLESLHMYTPTQNNHMKISSKEHLEVSESGLLRSNTRTLIC